MKRKRTRTRRPVAMKIPLLGCILLITLIPLLLQSRFLLSYFYGNQAETAMMEAQNRCLILTNRIRNLDYINGMGNNSADPGLDAEIRTTADLMNGRIVIIDGTFRIVRDTFDISRGRTVVVEEVLRAFRGETVTGINEEKEYFYLAIPVYGNPESAGTSGSGETVTGVLLMTASTEALAQAEERAAERLGLIQLFLLLSVAAAALVSISFLLRPFKKLQQQLNLVAEGNLDQDIRVDTYRETSAISEAVSHTIGDLKTLDQSRQEFVSNVSHELKTPITSIRVLADSLKGMENAPPELYREFLEDISDEIDREGKIIDDLLTLVKMDKSTPDLNIAQVSVNAMIEQILKRLRPIARKRNIELVYESIREVTADVDEVKLSLAISNLVENAIKYNHEEGRVRVTLDADHKFFYVRVIDNGVGIPAEFQERVFERFYRVDKARSRETGGTGLGLAITKNIVMMHQGAIRLQSKEGEGTTFTVRIPLNYIP